MNVDIVNTLRRFIYGDIGEELNFNQKVNIFLNNYWRGIVSILTPILLLPIVVGDNVLGWHWCAYTLLLMGIYWMTECIPMPVTSFLPIIIFPLTGILSTEKTCQSYMNDTVFMFLSCIMCASAVEQSNLHLRIVYKTANIIGLSRTKKLLAISFSTMIVALWVPSTAITSIMVPVTFAFLKIYEHEQVGSIFVVSSGGHYASRLTVCFFCAITYSASIGEAAMFINVPIELIYKNISDSETKDDLVFTAHAKFYFFSFPYIFVLQMSMCITLMVTHMGLFRPNSEDAKLAVTPERLRIAAKMQISEKLKKMGKITYHEIMVIIFFIVSSISAIGVIIYKSHKNNYLENSTWSMLANFVMLLWPSSCILCKYFTRHRGQLPMKPVVSVLDWHALNKAVPYNLMFLLGAPFSISEAAKPENTNFNTVVSEYMMSIKSLPKSVTLFLIIVSTNLVANVAPKEDTCNLFILIAFELALAQKVNPLWYGIAAAYSSSWCFLLPVGTPANLIVQLAAKIRTRDMISCGLAMTALAIIITWMFMYLLAPLVFNEMHHVPSSITIR